MGFKPKPTDPDFAAIEAWLVNSRIATENNALYQTIRGLLDRVKQLQDVTNAKIGDLLDIINKITIIVNGGGSSSTGVLVVTDGESGEDGMPGPPGPQGIQGPAGTNGIIGLNGIPGIDGIDGEDGIDGLPGIPGAAGAAGTNGTIGINGIPGLDGIDGEDGQDGTIGIQGATGSTGATGIQGSPGIPGIDAEEHEFPYIIPGPIGPTGPSANVKQTEIDFGSTPVSEASFTIVDADVSLSSQIIGTVAYEAPTGKDLDELEMDALDLKFGPDSGQFILYAVGMNGYIADKFKINYLVG